MKITEWLKDYGSDIIADDTYISDNNILFRKSFLDDYTDYVAILHKIKTHDKLPMEFIPYEEGECVHFSDKARLLPNKQIVVQIGDLYFDYGYLELAHQLLDIDHYTIVNPHVLYAGYDKYILKFWDEHNNFLGCLSNVIVKG